MLKKLSATLGDQSVGRRSWVVRSVQGAWAGGWAAGRWQVGSSRRAGGVGGRQKKKDAAFVSTKSYTKISAMCQNIPQTVLALRGSHGVDLVPGIFPSLWSGSAADLRRSQCSLRSSQPGT